MASSIYLLKTGFLKIVSGKNVPKMTSVFTLCYLLSCMSYYMASGIFHFFWVLSGHEETTAN